MLFVLYKFIQCFIPIKNLIKKIIFAIKGYRKFGLFSILKRKWKIKVFVPQFCPLFFADRRWSTTWWRMRAAIRTFDIWARTHCSQTSEWSPTKVERWSVALKRKGNCLNKQVSDGQNHIFFFVKESWNHNKKTATANNYKVTKSTHVVVFWELLWGQD